jgi:two-component system response regulator QseB
MRVLLVEDDTALGEGIQDGLKQEGYTVDWVQDGIMGESAIMRDTFDVCVLDLGLPKRSGIEVLKNVRREKCDLPVLILTARDGTEDRVQGLDAGADDYLTKPFDLTELCARLRALIRRASGRGSPTITYRDIELEPAAHAITFKGESVGLSRREFAILHALIEYPGKVIPRDRMIEILYGWEEEVDSNTLEVHIHHLRKKFGSDLIKTIRGVGYMVPTHKTV